MGELETAIQKLDEGLAKAEKESAALFCYQYGADDGAVSEG